MKRDQMSELSFKSATQWQIVYLSKFNYTKLHSELGFIKFKGVKQRFSTDSLEHKHRQILLANKRRLFVQCRMFRT